MRPNPYKQLRMAIRGRQGKNFGISRLSKELGISPACISKLERNINTPTLEVIVAYQRYFGVSYKYLIDPLFKNYRVDHRKK